LSFLASEACGPLAKLDFKFIRGTRVLYKYLIKAYS